MNIDIGEWHDVRRSCNLFLPLIMACCFPLPLSAPDDIKCFKIHGGEGGAPARLTFITNDGTSHATLELDEDAYNQLIISLQQRLLLER